MGEFCELQNLEALQTGPAAQPAAKSAPPPAHCHAGIGQLVRQARWLSSITPYAVGGLLLVAAALKIQQLVDKVDPAGGILASRWARVALIAVELACGSALVFGLVPRVTRRVCQLLFAGFLAFSVYQLAYGATACSCLGRVQLGGPAAMAALDFFALGGLWLWVPLPRSQQRSRLDFAVASAFWLVTIGAALQISHASASQIKVTPEIVELGRVQQAGAAMFRVALRNQGHAPVVVRRVDVSCPCVTCVISDFVLKEFAEAPLGFELDLAKEPGFSGALLVEATGWTDTNERAFVVFIAVVVEPGGSPHEGDR